MMIVFVMVVFAVVMMAVAVVAVVMLMVVVVAVETQNFASLRSRINQLLDQRLHPCSAHYFFYQSGLSHIHDLALRYDHAIAQTGNMP